MQITDISINQERLKADLQELSEIGRQEKDNGLHRMAFSDADMQARKWLQQKLRACDIDSQMDSAANVLAQVQNNPTSEQASIMTGSHLDTVPSGGHLDGALGVVAGLECLRVVKEQNIQTRFPFELVAFSDEEGRFGGMFGSLAMAGKLSPKRIQQSVALDGTTLIDAMQSQGLNAIEALSARRSPQSIKAFIELHIEQGPVLDRSGDRIGVVDTIIGLFKWSVRLKGETNHAGTTPMHLRHDSFAGLAEFSGELNRILEEHGSENSVATIGKVELFPGSANSIPGMTQFTLDVRDTSQKGLDDLADAIRRVLSAIARRRGLMFEFLILSEIAPVDCDSHIVGTIRNTTEGNQLPSRIMPSGAAHDAQTIAHITPVGMIMIPSIGGLSHSASEWSHWEDIIAGSNVLLHTLIQLAEPQEA